MKNYPLLLMFGLASFLVIVGCQDLEMEGLDLEEESLEENLELRAPFCNCEFDIFTYVNTGAVALDIRKNSTGTELPIYSAIYSPGFEEGGNFNEQIAWNSEIVIYFASNVVSNGYINVSIDCGNGKVSRVFCVDETVTPIKPNCPIEIQLGPKCKMTPQVDDSCEYNCS